MVPCRWTDMMNLIVAFHHFANLPNDENLGWYDIYILLTAIGLSPSGSSTVHIYTQTVHKTTQWNRIPRTYITIKIHKQNHKKHVPFSLNLLLYPWGFQSNAVFSIAPTSLRNVCPIKFHFLLFIWFSVGWFSIVLRL